jgi:hypothetical protein
MQQQQHSLLEFPDPGAGSSSSTTTTTTTQLARDAEARPGAAAAPGGGGGPFPSASALPVRAGQSPGAWVHADPLPYPPYYDQHPSALLFHRSLLAFWTATGMGIGEAGQARMDGGSLHPYPHAPPVLRYPVLSLPRLAGHGQPERAPRAQPLDLFKLFSLVVKHGGFDIINRDKRWNQVADAILHPHQGFGPQVCRHYYTHLRAFERAMFPKLAATSPLDGEVPAPAPSTTPRAPPLFMPPPSRPPAPSAGSVAASPVGSHLTPGPAARGAPMPSQVLPPSIPAGLPQRHPAPLPPPPATQGSHQPDGRPTSSSSTTTLSLLPPVACAPSPAGPPGSPRPAKPPRNLFGGVHLERALQERRPPPRCRKQHLGSAGS